MFKFWTKKEEKKEETKEMMERNKRLFNTTIEQLSNEEIAAVIERGNAACEAMAKLANGCIM